MIKMKELKITKDKFIALQKWALNESKLEHFLKGLKLFVNDKYLDNGLYVDYEVNEDDYPGVSVLSLIGIVNKKAYFFGELRAENHKKFGF